MDNIFTLRTLADSHAISKLVSSFTTIPNVVVIGSSFIGMEIASTLSKIAHVTVVGGNLDTPLQRILGPGMKLYT